MIDNCFNDLSFHFDTIMDVNWQIWQLILSSGVPRRRPPWPGSNTHRYTYAYTASQGCLSTGKSGRKGGACPAVLKMTVRGQSEHSQILARQELDKVLLPSDENTLNAVRRRELSKRFFLHAQIHGLRVGRENGFAKTSGTPGNSFGFT